MFSSIFLKRIAIIMVTSVAILASAASCSVPFGSSSDETYGVLKFDPTIRTDQFVRANAVQTLSGQVDPQGLTGVSVQKIVQVNTDKIYAMSQQRGIFYSENGGRVWKRRYIFKLSSDAESGKTTEDTNTLLAKNNSFKAVDIAINPEDDAKVYVAGSVDGIAKIYQSSDFGETFREIYSGVDTKGKITQILHHPKRTLELYALLGEQDIIRSSDGGQTWGKLNGVNGKPTWMGLTADSQKLYVARNNTDPIISSDGGNSWQEFELKKADKDEENNFSRARAFRKFQRLISLPNTNDQGWITVADSQIWFTENATQSAFILMQLPVQGDTYNVLDIVLHPQKGFNKLYVGVNNTLFVTEDKGKTWNIDERTRVTTNLGYIHSISIDKTNPEILFLGIANRKDIIKWGF